MTEEEIKALKPGNKFTVEYTVVSISDTSIRTAYSNGDEDGMPWQKNSAFAQVTTLVKPSPTFKVGDTVRVVKDPMTGTVYGGGEEETGDYCGEIGKIINFEWKGEGDVLINFSNKKINDTFINIHCLELVKKAVKDKYVVKMEDSGNAVVTIFDRETNNEVICYWKTHPNAEAAAKTECDRLNAEWRKQQQGQQ